MVDTSACTMETLISTHCPWTEVPSWLVAVDKPHPIDVPSPPLKPSKSVAISKASGREFNQLIGCSV